MPQAYWDGPITRKPGSAREPGCDWLASVAVGYPRGYPPIFEQTEDTALGGRHLHQATFTNVHWTTSFLSVSLFGETQLAQF